MEINPLTKPEDSRKAKINRIFKIVQIVTRIFAIILGCFVCSFTVSTEIKDEEIDEIKEVISYIWENGLQEEYENFSITKTGKNVNLHNLTNLPVKAPENADIEFKFDVNDYTVYRGGNIFRIIDNIGVRNISFNVEDGSIEKNVNYILAVIFVIFSCALVWIILTFFEMVLGLLISGIFELIMKINKKRHEK